MGVYVAVLFAAGILGFLLCEKNCSKKNEIIFVSIMTVLMCAVIVCRGEYVGIDYDWIYRDIFMQVNENNNFGFLFSAKNSYRTEFVFTLLNMAIAVFTDNPMVCFAVMGMLIVILRSVFILKYSPKPWISLFMYIALGFYVYSLCTIRQELAISVAMFALPYLLDRKPVPYFAVIILAGFIHNSLFMLLPLYFIVLLPPTKKWVMSALGAGMAIVFIFSETILALVTSNIERFSFYSATSEIGAQYLRGRNINTIVIWLVVLLLCGFYYKRIVERNPKNMMLFNLYLYGTIVMTFVVKHFVFQRVALMLLPFSIILIAEVMDSLDYRELASAASAKGLPDNKKNNAKKLVSESKRMYYSILALFMFFAAMEFFFRMYANRLDLVPYVTFWM